MPLPFRRYSGADQGVYAARKRSWAEQRAWEVEVILAPLHPMVREALRAWLLRPFDLHGWQPLETFCERRLPITDEESAGGSRPQAARLLREELRAILQTLAVPPTALSGLTRNGLLTAHAIRLRQVERWLWPFFAAREITKLIYWDE